MPIYNPASVSGARTGHLDHTRLTRIRKKIGTDFLSPRIAVANGLHGYEEADDFRSMNTVFQNILAALAGQKPIGGETHLGILSLPEFRLLGKIRVISGGVAQVHDRR